MGWVPEALPRAVAGLGVTEVGLRIKNCSFEVRHVRTLGIAYIAYTDTVVGLAYFNLSYLLYLRTTRLDGLEADVILSIDVYLFSVVTF